LKILFKSLCGISASQYIFLENIHNSLCVSNFLRYRLQIHQGTKIKLYCTFFHVFKNIFLSNSRSIKNFLYPTRRRKSSLSVRNKNHISDVADREIVRGHWVLAFPSHMHPRDSSPGISSTDLRTYTSSRAKRVSKTALFYIARKKEYVIWDFYFSRSRPDMCVALAKISEKYYKMEK